MNREMQELVDNRNEMRKESIIECEEVLEMARKISVLIEKTKDKLEEFSKIVLKNTEIFIEKNKSTDEMAAIRVPVNTFISNEINSLLDKKHGVWDEIENRIIMQYQNRGFPVVKRGGTFKSRISKSASRTINYRFEGRPDELRGEVVYRKNSIEK